MKKLLLSAAGGISLILIGLIFSYQPFMQRRSEKAVPTATTPFVATASASTTKGDYIEGRPVRIVIPSLHIDLQVVNGYYNSKKQTWTLTKDKAQYAVMTPQANTAGGNTFIYGHRNKYVFGQLSKIKTGAEVMVYTENNHRFTYRFNGAIETNPSDNSLFTYRGAPPKLTVQTCSGAFNQNRQLFTFTLEGAQ